MGCESLPTDGHETTPTLAAAPPPCRYALPTERSFKDRSEMVCGRIDSRPLIQTKLKDVGIYPIGNLRGSSCVCNVDHLWLSAFRSRCKSCTCCRSDCTMIQVPGIRRGAELAEPLRMQANSRWHSILTSPIQHRHRERLRKSVMGFCQPPGPTRGNIRIPEKR